MATAIEEYYRWEDICTHEGLLHLASSKTKSEEFLRLLDVHVAGYTQKKRLVEGLKEMQAKVQVVEDKAFKAKNLGKAAGKLEAEEVALTEKHSAPDLKEKVATVNARIQEMIANNQITSEERNQAVEHLEIRIKKAKEANKAALQEKLEGQMSSLLKSKPVPFLAVPRPSLEQLYSFNESLKRIAALEKKGLNSLNTEDRKSLYAKDKIIEDIEAVQQSLRLYYETDLEFKSRMSLATAEHAEWEEKQKKAKEEQAWGAKILQEDQMVQDKLAEKKRKEDIEAKKLADKLKAKREEAALKPVKDVPKAKPKPKKEVKRMNPTDMFVVAPLTTADQVEEPEEEWQEEWTPAASPEPSPDMKPSAAPTAPPAAQEVAEDAVATEECDDAPETAHVNGKEPAVEAVAVEEPVKEEAPAKPAKKEPVPAPWGSSAPAPAFADLAGPSLGDALKAPKKKGVAVQATSARSGLKLVVTNKPPPVHEVIAKQTDAEVFAEMKRILDEKKASEEAEALKKKERDADWARKKQELAEEVVREKKEAAEAAKAEKEEAAAAAAAKAAKYGTPFVPRSAQNGNGHANGHATSGPYVVTAAFPPANPSVSVVHKAVESPAADPENPEAEAPAPVKTGPPRVLENKWGAPVASTEEIEVDVELLEDLLPGPSLADAMKAVAPGKKAPPAPPKKKEKKSFAKVAAADCGFSVRL